MRYSPTITTTGRVFKQAPYDGLVVGEQKKKHFYVLQAIRELNPDKRTGRLDFSLCVVMGSFYVGDHGNVVGMMGFCIFSPILFKL